MKESIIGKIRSELEKGVTTEAQVVYMLAEIRKLIEGERLKDEFPDLNFHCDWTLHSAMDRAGAKAILRQFDEAQPLFKSQLDVHEFPPKLQREITRISQMKPFFEELKRFLVRFSLPPLTLHRSDGCVHFLHLYARVIEDIPLISAVSTTRHVSKVTVHFQFANEVLRHERGEEMLFQVTWRIFDKNGDCGDFSIFNSFSVVSR